MFYSQFLLSKNKSLGLLWMAAAQEGKITRSDAAKINIAEICREILNPSEPISPQLSAILMYGVVSVFQTKVKFLYDDVSRFKDEIDAAMRTLEVDRTVLPKGKSRAMSVTLPGSSMDTPNFRGMSMEDVDEQYFNVNPEDEDFSHSQANLADITLEDNFVPGLQDSGMFNRFERFEVEGDDTIINTAFLSPSRQESPPQQEQYDAAPSRSQEVHRPGDLSKQEDNKMQGQPSRPLNRQARRKLPRVIMDNELIIGNNQYMEWLNDPSDLVSRRNMASKNVIYSMEISDRLNLPPTAIIAGQNSSEVHYPKPLLDLFKDCTDSSSGGRGQQPSNSKELPTQPEMRARRMETKRATQSAEYDNANIDLECDNAGEGDHTTTPSLGLSRSSSSSGSGRGVKPLEREVLFPSGTERSKSKQQPLERSLGNLDPVVEDFPQQDLTGIRLRRVSNVERAHELLEETEPTQIPSQDNLGLADEVNQLQSSLKLHCASPGAPSLNQLAHGKTKVQAAKLFYHSCVLATLGSVIVTQEEPYGEILLSKGPEM